MTGIFLFAMVLCFISLVYGKKIIKIFIVLSVNALYVVVTGELPKQKRK